MPTVYLLHFATPYRHAGHYLGYTEDLPARVEEHRNGRGARLLQVIGEAGIGFEVVRTWEGDRGKERQLKKRHNGRRLCPKCNPPKGEVKD